MELPCPEIVRAVDSDTTTLFLLFSLVFTKPEILASDMIPRHTASVSIDCVPVSISPSTTRSNPLGRCKGGKEDASDDGLERRHGGDRGEAVFQPPPVNRYYSYMIYYSQAGDRIVLPRRPTIPRWSFTAPHGRRAGTVIFP